MDNVYSAGWVATGPTGVILTTMSNAFSIAATIYDGLMSTKEINNKPGFEEIEKLLKGRNVQIVSWNDWLKIDKYEEEQGKLVNKPREKIIDVKKMLEVAA